MAGYAIERVGDDAILEAIKSPRAFKDAAAQHRVSEAISHFPGTPYVWVQVAEMEVIFERAFLGALKDGGWKGENAGVEGNDIAKLEELAAAGARGIVILYAPSRATDFKGPSEALRNALKKEGIAASAGVIPSEAGLPRWGHPYPNRSQAINGDCRQPVTPEFPIAGTFYLCQLRANRPRERRPFASGILLR